MAFISWLAIGALLMFGELAFGNRYLLMAGLAFLYPALAAYLDADLDTQMTALGIGTVTHILLVMLLRRAAPPAAARDTRSDIGERVEVIEWMDECSAMVSYRGQIWEADKARAEMPDASHGIIKSVQGSRLVIITE